MCLVWCPCWQGTARAWPSQPRHEWDMHGCLYPCWVLASGLYRVYQDCWGQSEDSAMTCSILFVDPSCLVFPAYMLRIGWNHPTVPPIQGWGSCSLLPLAHGYVNVMQDPSGAKFSGLVGWPLVSQRKFHRVSLPCANPVYKYWDHPTVFSEQHRFSDEPTICIHLLGDQFLSFLSIRSCHRNAALASVPDVAKVQPLNETQFRSTRDFVMFGFRRCGAWHIDGVDPCPNMGDQQLYWTFVVLGFQDVFGGKSIAIIASQLLRGDVGYDTHNNRNLGICSNLWAQYSYLWWTPIQISNYVDRWMVWHLSCRPCQTSRLVRDELALAHL